ncbi:MAG: XdhC family protein [Chloroflexi bacterium]|nr:XdhC family protein [Chloroflexota bacterium]
MNEIIADVLAWRQQPSQNIAVATVIQTWGSAPRKAGGKMAFAASGLVSGSVSGGCIEGAVIAAGQEVLAAGAPQLLHFGVADETAWDVGLACGGSIEVFVQRLDTAVFDFLHSLIQTDQAGTCYTVIRGPEHLLGQQLAVSRDGRTAGHLPPELTPTIQPANQPTTQRFQPTPDVELFVETYHPAPTLVLVGGVHIAIALTPMGRLLGFRTVVVDPRRAFGSQARFAHADRLLPLWPDKAFAELDLTPQTAVVLLTHDPKIDDPALQIALNSPAFYIGALGSRKTHAKRVERLQALGLSPTQIARIHAPIGLNLHAQTAEEIALSIMAEIIQTYRGDEETR